MCILWIPGRGLDFNSLYLIISRVLCSGTLTFNFYALMFSHGLRHSSQELTRTSDTCFRLLLATAGAKVRRPYLYLLPAPLLITHHSSHRYQHSTPLPHSCVLRCRVEGLASCPKAAWVWLRQTFAAIDTHKARAILTMAPLTMAPLSMAMLTMALHTMALLTMALLTIDGLHRAE